MRYNFKKALLGKKNRQRVKSVVKAAKKRYVSNGSVNTQRIAGDIMLLKRALNVEKKRSDVAQGNGVSFAQFAGTSSGAYTADVTPVISQGVTGTTRNGLSVKLVSACLDIQIRQSVNTSSEFRFKWYLVCRPDASIFTNAAVAFNDFLENNLFSGVRDYHSNRDPETYHQFRVIKTGKGKLVADSISGQISYYQTKVPIKLSHHLKYQTDISTTTTKNQLFLFAVGDTGESATALSGGQIFFNIRYYYVDN